MLRLAALVALLSVCLVPLARAETRLLMAEEPGCLWCAQWNAEIAPIYPRTPEGEAAPLQRFDIRDGAPGDVALDRKVIYTPTFILVRDGEEEGRIEGYPGEDFFWGLLGELLERARIDVNRSG